MFDPEEFFETAKQITGGVAMQGPMMDEAKPRNGHPRFYELTAEEENLHSAKNYDYARGGDPLGNFNRVAKIFSLYPGLNLGDPTVVAIAYAMKQMDAVLWMLAQGYEGEVEGIKERLRDIGVYAKLEIILEEQKTLPPHGDALLKAEIERRR